MEFTKIKLSDLEDTGKKFIISIVQTKNDVPRNFIIGGDYYHIVKKYLDLRPDDMPTDRFFIQYRNGKCTRQVIGRDSIRAIPKIVAEHLKLDVSKFTGHGLRRTSATLLSNTGANLDTVKLHLGHKSNTASLRYIEHSLANRQDIFEKIATTKTDQPCVLNLNKSNDFVFPSSSNVNVAINPNKINAQLISKPSTSGQGLKNRSSSHKITVSGLSNAINTQYNPQPSTSRQTLSDVTQNNIYNEMTNQSKVSTSVNDKLLKNINIYIPKNLSTHSNGPGLTPNKNYNFELNSNTQKVTNNQKPDIHSSHEDTDLSDYFTDDFSMDALENSTDQHILSQETTNDVNGNIQCQNNNFKTTNSKNKKQKINTDEYGQSCLKSPAANFYNCTIHHLAINNVCSENKKNIDN